MINVFLSLFKSFVICTVKHHQFIITSSISHGSQFSFYEVEKCNGRKKEVVPSRRWNTPYCEEVGATGKVSGLGWSGGGGHQVLSKALCLHFAGTIPECHLLICRLLWQCYSWQLACFLHASPFQEWQQWCLKLARCQCYKKLAPPFTWIASHSCQLLTLWPFLSRDIKHKCDLTRRQNGETISRMAVNFRGTYLNNVNYKVYNWLIHPLYSTADPEQCSRWSWLTGVRGEFNLTGQMEGFPSLLDLFLHIHLGKSP